MDSAQFYIQEFLETVSKRKRLIGLFLALVLAIVVLGTLRQNKIYRAKTTIEVGIETPNVTFFNEVVSDNPTNWWAIQTFYETQYKIIKSRHLMGLVVDKLIADKSVNSKNRDSLIGWLQAAVSVKPIEKSRLAVISMDDTSPARAAHISDLVATTYIEENLNRKIESAKDAAKMLSKQIGAFRDEKSKSDGMLQKFKEEHNIVSLENKRNIVKDNLMALNTSLNTVKNQRIMLEAKYKALKSIIGETGSSEELYGAVGSELMKNLKVDYDVLVRQYGEMSKRYRAKHPEILKIKAKINETESAVKREADAELSKLKTEYLLARAQERSIAANLEKQKREALKIDALNLEMENISSIQSTNKDFYTGLTKKLKEADLTGLIKSNNVRIVDLAIILKSPIKPNIKLNILMALVFGVLGGIGIAYFLESMDNTVKSEEDIEKYVKSPILGVIPLHDAENDKEGIPVELMTTKNKSSTIAENYRTIRTNITFMSKVNGYKTFLITSAGVRDGKTTSVINLAASISQAGFKTLLIDLDLRKSRISSVLDIERENGISDFLISSEPIHGYIKKNALDGIDVLTTGSLPPNPAELLGFPKLKEALNDLKNSYDQIIIDASPVIPVTDALIASQIVDGVILVVGADQTGKSMLKSSKDQLLKVDANILGVIFNGVNVEKKKYLAKYYGYRYYAKGYYYGEDKAKENKDDKRVDA